MAEKQDTDKKKSSKATPKAAAATAEKKTAEKKISKTETKKSGAFAVIATGGKQYVVREGEFLSIEKLAGDYKEGAKIEFSDVLLTDNGKETAVGTPTISGAKVTGEFVEDGRAKKISVIRFRSKSRYFKNKGHRQPYTRVKITKV